MSERLGCCRVGVLCRLGCSALVVLPDLCRLGVSPGSPGICGPFHFVVPVVYKHCAGYGFAFINFFSADRVFVYVPAIFCTLCRLRFCLRQFPYLCTRFLQYTRRSGRDANIVIFSFFMFQALGSNIKREINCTVLVDAVDPLMRRHIHCHMLHR